MSRRTRIIIQLGIFSLLIFIGMLRTELLPRYYVAPPGHRTTKQLQAIGKGLELFQGDYGKWPSMSEGLNVLLNDPKGPYIVYPHTLIDLWGREVLYHLLPDGTATVTSLGADGKPGGRGYDTDIVVSVGIAR